MKINNKFKACFLSIALLTLDLPLSVAQINSKPIAPSIDAKAYLIQDVQSGQILSSSHEKEKIEPASLTKLMTAYITFSALKDGKIKLDQMVTVSKKGYEQEGSRMYLDPRTPARIEDVIKGMIVQSGNDASVTLAETVAGSEEAFVLLMNDQAQRLGMNSTRFANCTGLPDDKMYTTATDLATLSRALMNDFPQFYPYYSIKSFTYNNIPQPNRNTLLFKDPNVDGLKTGHTKSAGYNLIASNKRNGRRVLSVVVGTKSMAAREVESSKLLNWVLQSFETPKLYDAGQVVSKAKVYKGKKNELGVGFLSPVYATVPLTKTSEISPILETYQPVVAPVKKGQKIGTLKVMHKDVLLYEIPAVALDDVEEAGFFGRIWDSIILWFKSF